MLWTIQKEDYTYKEQQVIIAGHHVFGSQVHERKNCRTINGLHKVCVRPFDRVSE
jgi:hypothetical protein